MNSRYKGIFFITLSALSFAFMNAFVRLSGDLPSVQKSFFRNLVAFFIALIMIIRSKDGFKIEKGNLKYMILRATFGTVGILCNFYAVDHLVLSDASMLNKMSPFFAILFSMLSVFTLMPGLLMLFANALVRTQHREFLPKIDRWGRLVVKLRYIGVPVFLVVLVAGFILANRCPYVYGDTLVKTTSHSEQQIADQRVDDTFGAQNAAAVGF